MVKLYPKKKNSLIYNIKIYKNKKSTLRSHFDGVRDCFFTKNNTLVTVSEDCMVKLWDVR